MVRQSQLVGHFGPGSFVDLPERSVIVAGLDEWEHRAQDQVHDPRVVDKLSHALGIANLQLFSPPPFDEAPDAPKLGIGARLFPTWFVTQGLAASDPGKYGRRRLIRIEATQKHGLRYQDPEDQNLKSLSPIRFVCACSKGHTSDVDWRVYVHKGRTTCQRTLWLEERGTSGEVADTWIGCDCGERRQLYEALDLGSQPLGWCSGSRPWLGNFANEQCDQPNRLLVRSASNAYFAEVMSAISLPDKDEELANQIGDVVDLIKNATTENDLETLKKLLPQVKVTLEGFSTTRVLEFVKNRNASTKDTVSVKEAEFQVLTSGVTGRDEPDSDYYSETLDRKEWDPHREALLAPIEAVVLVHRLREVIAQIGFTRFEPASPHINGELDMDVQRQTLATDVRWLPAVEHRGEGVFFQVSAEAISSWLDRPDVKSRADELADGFALWAAERKIDRSFVGAPYVLLHSLSHLLIASIALECGYPATSLRERVYALPGQYGILIHTGSSDSAGTLGGLVQSGRRLRDHLKKALVTGELCSNDPVCSDHQANNRYEKRFLHGAACHGCLLIAEPSCEQRNDLLDRAVVVPTVRTPKAAFFPATRGG